MCLCVARACRHHLSCVHPYRVGVQSEPGCSSPYYLPTYLRPSSPVLRPPIPRWCPSRWSDCVSPSHQSINHTADPVLLPPLVWRARFILFIRVRSEPQSPVPTPTGEVQVLETRVDLSNDMTWRQMIGVGVRRVVLARGELDKLEGPKYAARRAELRRKAGEAARAS